MLYFLKDVILHTLKIRRSPTLMLSLFHDFFLENKKTIIQLQGSCTLVVFRFKDFLIVAFRFVLGKKN